MTNDPLDPETRAWVTAWQQRAGEPTTVQSDDRRRRRVAWRPGTAVRVSQPLGSRADEGGPRPLFGLVKQRR